MRVERMEAIVAMRRDGKTLQEIGDHYGVSRERIRQILSDSGADGLVGRSRRPLTPEQIEDVQSRWRAGTKAPEIAEALGVSVSKVRAAVAGIPRPRIPNEREARILELWDQRKSMTAVARELGLPSYRAAQAVVHRYRPILTRKEAKKRDMQMRMMAVRGLSVSEIAEQMGLTYSNTCRILNAWKR